MPGKSTQHQRAQGTTPSALLIVDIINPMDFPGADRLRHQAEAMLPALVRLKRRLKARGLYPLWSRLPRLGVLSALRGRGAA